LGANKKVCIQIIRVVIDDKLGRGVKLGRVILVLVKLVLVKLVLVKLGLILMVNEQLIFQLDDIQLFQLLFLMGYIQYICLDKLKEYIQFSIQRHSNR